MAVVGKGPCDVPPAEVAARPIAPAGRGAAGERLIGHRLGPAAASGLAPVVGYSGLIRESRSAQDHDVTVSDEIGHEGAAGLPHCPVVQGPGHFSMVPQPRARLTAAASRVVRTAPMIRPVAADRTCPRAE